MDVSLVRAELTALLLESLVYGFFLLLFSVLLCITLISTRGTHMPSKRYVIPIATLMMAIATAHLIVDFLRVLQAFIPDDPRQTADKFFKQLSHPYAVLNWALFAFQTILGDSVLVWRCYVLCNKKWWMLIPGTVILLFNTAVVFVITKDLTIAVGAKFIHLITPWVITLLVNTTVLQFFYSAAIIVKMARSFPDATSYVTPVITAVVESCAIYTLFALGLLIAYLSASNADWVLIDMITPLVGVSFCLIIIQLHVHYRVGYSNTTLVASHQFRRPHKKCSQDTVAERGAVIGMHSHSSTFTSVNK